MPERGRFDYESEDLDTCSRLRRAFGLVQDALACLEENPMNVVSFQQCVEELASSSRPRQGKSMGQIKAEAYLEAMRTIADQILRLIHPGMDPVPEIRAFHNTLSRLQSVLLDYITLLEKDQRNRELQRVSAIAGVYGKAVCVAVREMTPGDDPDFLCLERQCHHSPWTAAELRKLRKFRPDSPLRVADVTLDRTEMPARVYGGHVSVGNHPADPTLLEVQNVAVPGPLRRHSIGATLVQRAIQTELRDDTRAILAPIGVLNTDARGFFGSSTLGFGEGPLVPQYFTDTNSPGEGDALIMMYPPPISPKHGPRNRISLG